MATRQFCAFRHCEPTWKVTPHSSAPSMAAAVGLGGCLIEGSVMGTLSGSYTECGGTLYVDWSFTDECLRTITHQQVITVEAAPMAAFVIPPQDITITCSSCPCDSRN